MSNYPHRGSDFNMRPFELLDLVKKDILHPFDDYGNQIPSPTVQKSIQKKQKLEDELKTLPLEYGKIEALCRGEAKETEKQKLDLRKKSLQMELYTLKQEMDVFKNKYSWAEYKLPEDQREAMKVFDILLKALYHRNDVAIASTLMGEDILFDSDLKVVEVNTTSEIRDEEPAQNRQLETEAKQPQPTPQEQSEKLKKIGYSDFVRIFHIKTEELDDWEGLLVRADGIYVNDPETYKDCLLFPEELSILTEHPAGDLSKPVLPFPCSKRELTRFIDSYGLEGCYDEAYLERVTDERVSDTLINTPLHSAVPQTFNNAFIRQGNVWEIFYQGEKLTPVIHLVGLTYIAELLKRPTQLIHVTDLCNAVNFQRKEKAMMEDVDLANALNTENMSISGMQYDELDDNAKKDIKGKLNSLQEIIDDHESLISEREEANHQKEEIMKILNSQYGLNPLSHRAPRKPNQAVKQDLDRAKAAIKRAFEEINKQSPELVDYLKTTIKTGTYYSFTDSGIPWNVSF